MMQGHTLAGHREGHMVPGLELGMKYMHLPQHYSQCYPQCHQISEHFWGGPN